MKKLYLLSILFVTKTVFADLTGLYVGGGIGYGMQNITYSNINNITGTPSLRGFVGYQMADWVGAEAGYTYISQAGNWNNLGSPSATVYDIAFTPGFSLPIAPVTIYGRFGIDGISANLNSSWYNQIFSGLNANFEWGAGVKVNIPATRVFIRAEYINYNSAQNNNNGNVNVTPSTVMINAAYVF